MDTELLKHLKDFSPLTLTVLVVLYAMKKLPTYSLKKMELENQEKDKILVHLNAELDELKAELGNMKKELVEYRQKFFDLQEEHARLKAEHEQLRGVLKAYEQKKTKR